MKPKITFYSYRLLARFSEVLPGKAIGPLAKVIGAIAAALGHHQRDIVARNLQRVMGRSPTPVEVRAAFSSYVRYWFDAMRAPTHAADRLAEICLEEGYEHIAAAREKGNGVILALPHMGNWDVAGAWLVQQQRVPLTVVVEQLEPPELFTWFKDFRESLGLSVVVNGPRVAAQLSAALKRNEAIALLCDRDIDGTGIDVEFFGEVTKLPKGPATLAKRTHAALLPVAVYERGDRYCATMGAPVEIDYEAETRAEIDRATNELTRRVEELIRRAPTQWHVFQPNWPSDR